MFETTTKFVRFDFYCPKCEYSDIPEVKDPCNECLEHGARADGTEKPVYFKEKENVK